MDELEAEAIRLMREALKKRRGYADYHSWPLDRDLEEAGGAEELRAALAEAGTPLVRSVRSRGRGNDPPDCEGTDSTGRRIAIEVTELVDPDAIRAVKQGASAYSWAEWTQEKLASSVSEALRKKDSRRLRDGPYGSYVVILHTDEPELGIDRVRSLLNGVTFKCGQVNRAFLLLSYDPQIQRAPFMELRLLSPE